jgi:molybdopterin converting factor small subunit
MIVVRLRFFGALQQYVGGARFEVELPTGARLRDLLDLIDVRWGGKFPPEFWDAEARRFPGPILIMTNDVDVEDENMALSDQQEIFVVEHVAGGQ